MKFRGISKTPYGRWYVRGTFLGKKYYLGCYSSFEEAKKARVDFESSIGYVRKKTFLDYDHELVLFLYFNNSSIKDIMLKTGANQDTISKIRKYYYLPVRIPCFQKIDDDIAKKIKYFYLIKRKTITEISKFLDISCLNVKRCLIQQNIKIRKGNTIYEFVDKSFLERDEPWVYYFIGLCLADASFREENGLRIRLTEKDKPILDKLNKKIYKNKKLLYEKGYSMRIKGKRTYKKPMYGIVINNKNMFKKLNEYGIKERKTHSMCFSNLINKENIWHILRGYFDGDGHSAQRSFVLCVSFDFGNSLQEKMKEWFGITSYVHKNHNANIYMFYVHKKEDRLKIYYNMYKNTQGFFLERKKNKFKEYLKI